jgi:signal transduction histidine kinase
MSIRLRLTLWYSGIVAATLLAFGAVLYGFLHYFFYGDMKQQLSRHATALNPRQNIGTIWGQPYLDLEIGNNESLRDEQFYIQLVNYYNGELKRSTNLFPYKFAYPENEPKETYERQKIGDVSFLIYNRPLYFEGEIVGLLQVGLITNAFDAFFGALGNVLLITSAVVIGIGFTLGLFLARKALKPIEDVIAAARQIENGADLDNRIIYDGPNDEIGRLVSTLNGMLARLQTVYSELEEAYRAQRRFVSDASHELRTPLTTIRGNVDLLEKMWKQAAETADFNDETKRQLTMEAMQDIADESRRMTRLVNDMLSLARADAGYEMDKAPVALKPLVEEVARRAQFLTRTAAWEIGDLHVLDEVEVYGNKDYLQQMLFIFIENAFKYTPEGSVKLDALRESGQIGIRISDTGIGMDEQEVPHIFERFYRADVSRGKTAGTGLGLSIAKWIIDEHAGSVEVMTAKGEGTTFVIWLPIYNSAADDAGVV